MTEITAEVITEFTGGASWIFLNELECVVGGGCDTNHVNFL